MAEGFDLKLTEDDERRILDLARESGEEPIVVVRNAIAMLERQGASAVEEWSPEYRAYVEREIEKGLASGPAGPMESADEMIERFRRERSGT